MTYLRKPRKDGNVKPRQIRCRSSALIDMCDEKVLVKVRALVEREKQITSSDDGFAHEREIVRAA